MSAISQILGEMTTKFGKSWAYTHPGEFSADNVLCGALCKLMNPDLKIYRTAVEPTTYDLDTTVYYDFRSTNESITVYNSEINIERRPDGVKYGSFGLLWRDYGAYIILPWEKPLETREVIKYMVDKFDEQIIEPMDSAIEQGISHPWIEMLNNYNYIANEKVNYTENTETVMYNRALTVGIEFLQRWCEIYNMACKSLARIYESYNPNGDMIGIIYIDDQTDIDTEWALEFVREHIEGVYYAIRPSQYRGYNIYSIKKSSAQLEKEYPGRELDKLGIKIYKRPFPTDWYGLKPEQLSKYYDNLFFAANDGSMVTVEDYETAVKIAKNLNRRYTNINNTPISSDADSSDN